MTMHTDRHEEEQCAQREFARVAVLLWEFEDTELLYDGYGEDFCYFFPIDGLSGVRHGYYMRQAKGHSREEYRKFIYRTQKLKQCEERA